MTVTDNFKKYAIDKKGTQQAVILSYQRICSNGLMRKRYESVSVQFRNILLTSQYVAKFTLRELTTVLMMFMDFIKWICIFSITKDGVH
jgi:hypothetical protein